MDGTTSDMFDRCEKLEAELDKAAKQIATLELQIDALKKFYDWSMDAGSWSDVGLHAKDGTRWIISVEETKEMERLMGEVDAVLGKTEKRICAKCKVSSHDYCAEGGCECHCRAQSSKQPD